MGRLNIYESPIHTIKANELVSMPLNERKELGLVGKVIWSILTVVTIALLIWDLFVYQKIETLETELLLIAFYTRITFPMERKTFKIIVWIATTLVIALSLLGGELFLHWILLIILAPVSLWASFSEKYHRVPSPFEIRFYKEHLVIYREKHYYNRKVTRKETYSVPYSGIREIRYKTLSKRFMIFGDMEWIFYNYDKDGRLPYEPTASKDIKGGMCYFYHSDYSYEDYIDLLERFTGLKVVQTDN